MQLSIIIPVYKVEAYLEKCIRSLQHQDIPADQYEIIIVNDGSPDGCRDIVLRLQREFQNIVLIDQVNQGVSMARNNAIARASGEYILPIDPDDFVIENTFKYILNRVNRQDLDVLYLGFTILDEKGQPCWKTDYAAMGEQVFSGVEGYFAGRGSEIRDPDRSWAILYKRSLLKRFNISYPRDVPYLEDGLFLAKVFAVAVRCGFDNRPFYQRTTRPGSATHSTLFYTERALNGFIKAATDIREFRQSNSLSDEQSGLVNHVIAKFVLLPVISCVGDKNWPAFKKIKPVIVKAGFNQLELKGCRSIYQQYARHFNQSKNWFFFYYTWQSFLSSINYRMGRVWPTANNAG
jgi:glycosyltransferase involved in cell wall biosynthesis